MVGINVRNDDAVQSRIRSVLETREAMTLPELVQAVDADRETVVRELRNAVHTHQIERLSPVLRHTRTERGRNSPATQYVYYRWRRPTDDRHLWQTRIMADNDIPLPRWPAAFL